MDAERNRVVPDPSNSQKRSLPMKTQVMTAHDSMNDEIRLARRLAADPLAVSRMGPLSLETCDLALGFMEHRGRMWALWWWHYLKKLSPEDLRVLLARHWPNSDIGGGPSKTQIVALFKAAGFMTDTEGVELPRHNLTVHRGSAPAYRRGLAWTLDPETAEFFAERERHFGRLDARVYVAETAPHHVLAIFLGRKEEEVVVNPRGLLCLRQAESAPSTPRGTGPRYGRSMPTTLRRV